MNGYRRIANTISRELFGYQETRTQRVEQRPPKLDETAIDLNAYRQPVVRQRAPQETKSRRRPGWTDIRIVLPSLTSEGLSALAKTMADKDHAERSSEPLGFRRRYPKTRSYYVIAALNLLFEEFGMPEFRVEEKVIGHTRRFVAPLD